MNIDWKSRTGKARLNSLLLLVFKGASICISLFYVPLLLDALSEYEYAIWLTLTSVVGWLVISDIGLGNGLRNRVAENIAAGRIVKCREYISTAYVTLSALLGALVIVFLCSASFIDWAGILNAEDVNHHQLTLLVIVVFVSFCMQLALNLINSVLLAMQMPALSSGIAFGGQALSFAVVLILVKLYHINSLLVLGTAISIAPLLIYAIFTFAFYQFYEREFKPSFKCFRKDLIKDILSLGIKFFFLQLIGILLFYSNNLIITHAVGSEAVVEYNISYKYMNCIYMLFMIISTPIWSATTDAYAKGDIEWIRNTNRRLLKVVAGLGVIGLIMLFASGFVFRLWLGNDTYCNYTNLLLLLLYFLAQSLYGCYGYILNGMGKLKLQIYVTAALAALYVPMAYYSGEHMNLSGILIIFLMVQVVNCCWSMLQYNKLINGTARGIWNE